MRLVSARWIFLLLVVVGAATAAGLAGQDGRWKLGDDGSCYFDATDSGPDQCSPVPGRWKLGGDGSCYFDPTDEGPDQCTPPPAAATVLEESASLTGVADRPHGDLVDLPAALPAR
jgi:hypothetical protein